MGIKLLIKHVGSVWGAMDVEQETQALELKVQTAAELCSPGMANFALVQESSVIPDDLAGHVRCPPEVSSHRAPLVVSTFNVDKYVDKLPSAINKRTLPPSLRIAQFIFGLVIAGTAGSFSNACFTEGTDAFFAPQYVKHFRDAERIPERNLAFSEMRNALANGEQQEPHSSRFTNLVARLAEQLDSDGRYIEAKAQWARAAVFSETASPEVRERKRSFLINEADSEDSAFLNFLKDDIDSNLVQKVEDAGSIFQKSAVIGHSWRAFRAFIKAGQLSADDNNFAHAQVDFDRAEKIADSQCQNNGAVREILLEARWRAELQRTIAGALALRPRPISDSQEIPSDENSRLEFSRVIGAPLVDFDKITSALDRADKSRAKDFYGESRVSQMYAELAEIALSAQGYPDRLIGWASVRPHSARPLIAEAFLLNMKAAIEVRACESETIPESVRSEGFKRLLRAAQVLNRALLVEPEVCSEPSFLQAIQDNLNTSNALLGLDNNDGRMISDLRFANSCMSGTLAQFYFNEINYKANSQTADPETFKWLLRKALLEADRINSDAGAEYYARAVYAAQRPYEWLGLDADKFAKGEQLLSAQGNDSH
jgi:hypothetical protein